MQDTESCSSKLVTKYDSKNIPIATIGTRNLYPLWLGPFPVTQKVGAVAYELEIPPHYRLHNIFHVSLLKPAYDNHAGTPPPAPRLVEGEDEFEVETILQHRPLTKPRGDKNISYRVKWLGYGPDYNSWELKEISNSTRLRNCRSTGKKLQCRQLLSLKQALALGWPLVTSNHTV